MEKPKRKLPTFKGLDKLNEKQIEMLESYKTKQFELQREVHNDIMPLLVQSLNQARNLIRDMAIISGAIATFSLPLLATSLVKTPFFLYLGVGLLFFLIGYSFYQIKEVVTKEINNLAKQHSTYIGVLNETIERINKVYEDGDASHLVKFDAEEAVARLDNLQETPRKDSSLDDMCKVLIVALISIFLSLVDYNYIIGVVYELCSFYC